MPSQKWGKNVSNKHKNTSLLVVKDHHLLRVLRINSLEKLGSKELYSFLLIMVISATDHQPAWQKYFYNLFRHIELFGKRSTLLRIRWLLTVTYVVSITKFLKICLIWIRSFFNSVRLKLPCSFCHIEAETTLCDFHK